MAGYLFNGTFRFQLWIVAYFPGNLLDLTLHFVKLTFCFVLIARFHTFSFRFFIYLLDRHPFRVGIEPHSEAMICDNSMHFLSKDTHIMTNIIPTVAASSLPTTGNNQKF
jgi:hypothetical protein